MPPLITAKNLRVVRRDKVVLNDVSLDIGERDFVTIVGPNGAGKTMLLKCLMNFYRPDGGEVLARKDLKIGYVPQKLALPPSLTITARRFLSLRKEATTAAVTAATTQTGTQDVLDTPMQALSGGQLQRILVARALLGDSNLLVLDEPAQQLDVAGQLAFYQLLERVYRERKIAILMVSHDLHFVMRCSRRVLCLYHHVCCQGAPQAVSRDPAFVSLFGEDMARMMAVYQHHHDHDHEHRAG